MASGDPDPQDLSSPPLSPPSETPRLVELLNSLEANATLLQRVEERARDVASSLDASIQSLRDRLHNIVHNTFDVMDPYAHLVEGAEKAVGESVNASHVFIRKCLQLNEEMKIVEALATEVNDIKRGVDYLEYMQSRIPLPLS